MEIINDEISHEIERIGDAFPGSFITPKGEIIVHRQANEYFSLSGCYSRQDIQAKVLEWLSRGACKTAPFYSEKLNKSFWNFMQRGINNYLGTQFTQEDFEKIYQHLGNGVHHDKTIHFIESGFRLSVLDKEV